MTKVNSSETREARQVQNFNAMLTLILCSPLRGLFTNRLVLVTFSPDANDRSLTIPVSYVKDGETLLVTDDGFWQKKLRAGVDVSVFWNGQEQRVQCEVIRESAELARLVSTMSNGSRALRRFVTPLLGPDKQPMQDKPDYARRQGFALIRLHLNSQVGSS